MEDNKSAMDKPTRLVAAAVVVDEGRVWLIRYLDNQKMGWQLINKTFEPHEDPITVIVDEVQRYGFNVSHTKRLSEHTITSAEMDTTVVGVKVDVENRSRLSPGPGIELWLVETEKIDELGLYAGYKKFVKEALDIE